MGRGSVRCCATKQQQQERKAGHRKTDSQDCQETQHKTKLKMKAKQKA